MVRVVPPISAVGGGRERPSLRAVRRQIAAPIGGRAWINGREVGSRDHRFDHLTRSYD